jgi:hypothetical protein
MNRRDFIDPLVEDLGPVRAAEPTASTLVVWTLFAWLVAGALVLGTGPLRDGAIATLATSPRYTLEFILAVLGGLAAVLAGLELGVPGESRVIRLVGPPFLLLGGWLAIVVYGLGNPAIETGLLGKRPYCDIQTLLFAFPALGIGLYALGRRALFMRTATGALLGLGAASIPAAWMQLACLYDPLHALTHHLAPIAIVSVLGSLAARWLLPRH